ncbi:MAG TPA: ABC transporter ATP-binding protein [Candidatus Nitrosotalea sp.]|nr:ABC transporter ATP-binding protein [Candidatus Nitrosotalea sp.]
MAIEQEPGIRIEGLSKRFFRPAADGSGTEMLHVLDRIELEVRPHEFMSLIGPSGCGKTTLLRMIAGLARADEGSLRIGSEAITGPGPERAMVFQDFALLPWASVLDNVAFGLKLRRVRRTEREATALDLIRAVGLEGFEKALPRQLSGGMQQRVGLARALAMDPRFLLLDEPFGALDEISRRVMQDELIRIWESDKKTAVFVTHSVDEAVFLSDRIVIMSSRPGRIADIVEVGLPRPRTRDMEQDRIFIEIRARIWQALGL